MVYYNEINKFCAEWLRNLIAAGHLPAGDVDERSIEDVTPNDLAGYKQCHFFAGIGGWPLALRLAGWPEDMPVWTGSCPCQPFSRAGTGGGFADERHLWPAWYWLISQHQPTTVFGEQVASPMGRSWLDLVSTDMEGIGYAIGAAVLPAASVGAPHKRDRLWFVADAKSDRCKPGQEVARCHTANPGGTGDNAGFGGSGKRAMANPNGNGRIKGGSTSQGSRHGGPVVSEGWADNGLGDADTERLSLGECIGSFQRDARCTSAWETAFVPSGWEWVECSDGKQRPIEPGILPLAHGIPGRVGQIRAYGNAVVPEVAAMFIESCLEA